ncbi:MAG: DUF2383 domain-containing protein [Betaproteobacteria bacterium]
MYLEHERLVPSLRALEKLERSALLCHQVFAQASAQVVAEDLRALLARRSQDHRAAAALLQAHSRRLGAANEPMAVPTAPDWLASHSLRTEAIDAVLLDHCERFEDDLLEAMGDALAENIEPASALAIEQLRLQTRAQHTLLRTMRDRLRQLLWRPIVLSEVLTPEQQSFALLHQQVTGLTKGQQDLGRHVAKG